MRHFSATELARMQAAQTSAMQDTGVRLAYSATTDAYGNPVASYTPGTPGPCGFDPTNDDEVQESGQVVTAEAAIRLPIDTVLDPRDRWRITHRFGVAVTAMDYEIIGLPQRGPSGLVLKVRKVTS